MLDNFGNDILDDATFWNDDEARSDLWTREKSYRQRAWQASKLLASCINATRTHHSTKQGE